MEKVRIGFVGVGAMGQCAHLKSFVTVKDCQVVAIAELRQELARKVAARYGVPKVYKDHAELLANEALDGIVASQPFSRHGVLVPELYKAGAPVMTEKPLAASVQVGESLVRALADSGTWHMVGYNKRSDPATMYAKSEIDRLKATGELGRMRYVRILVAAGDWIAGGFADLIKTGESVGQLQTDPPADDMDQPTYKQYTSFVNYYIHQVNLMRHLLGEPYEVAHAEASGVVMVVRSESGVAGTIEMCPYQVSRDWQESALVAFERGYVKLELRAPLAWNRAGRVEILRDPGGGATPETMVPQFPPIGSMRQQAINFVRAIKGEARPPCEAAEALEDLKVARQYLRLLKGV